MLSQQWNDLWVCSSSLDDGVFLLLLCFSSLVWMLYRIFLKASQQKHFRVHCDGLTWHELSSAPFFWRSHSSSHMHNFNKHHQQHMWKERPFSSNSKNNEKRNIRNRTTHTAIFLPISWKNHNFWNHNFNCKNMLRKLTQIRKNGPQAIPSRKSRPKIETRQAITLDSSSFWSFTHIEGSRVKMAQ